MPTELSTNGQVAILITQIRIPTDFFPLVLFSIWVSMALHYIENFETRYAILKLEESWRNLSSVIFFLKCYLVRVWQKKTLIFFTGNNLTGWAEAFSTCFSRYVGTDQIKNSQFGTEKNVKFQIIEILKNQIRYILLCSDNDSTIVFVRGAYQCSM